MTKDHVNALLSVILESVAESPDGAPSGPIFLAFSEKGISLGQYQALVSLGERADLWTISAHVLRLTDKGRALVKQLAEMRAEAAAS